MAKRVDLKLECQSERDALSGRMFITVERTSASLFRNDEMASVPFCILIPVG